MNKQITEDYASFETAKLLSEKEFDELCFALYNPEEELIQCGVKLSNTQVGRVPGSYSAPTHQMACKWLREVHNWYIDIRFNRHYQYYIPIVYNMSGTLESIANLEERPKQYEQAVEAALNYVLKNLI